MILLIKRSIFVLTAIAVNIVGVRSWEAFATDSQPDQSMIRVAVTSQSYNFLTPWEKRSPRTKIGIGAVLPGNRILVTARLIANSTFVELEKIENGEKCPASVIQVDYSADLALLHPNNGDYMSDLKGIAMYDKTLVIGDELGVWQFESNGTPVITEGELKGIEVSPYPFRDSARLIFNVKVLLSEVGSSYTLPVIRSGKLVGMLMNHNSGSQTMKVIPPPVLNHFLLDLENPPYEGFPQGAFLVSSLEDPQLRRFLGVEDEGGVFIDQVRPGGPADRAGLQVGDVLLAVDDFEVDESGQYDDVEYGKLAISHLTTTRSHAGDTRIFTILREKKKISIDITLQPLKPEDYPIPPHVIDKAPEYIVVGGLVFQELTSQYLMEWGSNWQSSVPQRLLHYQRNQWDLVPPGNKLVILGKILPSQGNLGYDGLMYMILKSINQESISSIKDIPMALEAPINGFHHIEFVHDPKFIYLEASELSSENKTIKNRYNLPALSHFNGE